MNKLEKLDLKNLRKNNFQLVVYVNLFRLSAIIIFNDRPS